MSKVKKDSEAKVEATEEAKVVTTIGQGPNKKVIIAEDEIADASNYKPTITEAKKSSGKVMETQENIDMLKNLQAHLDIFGKENNIEFKVGKLSRNNNNIILSMQRELKDCPEGITSAQYDAYLRTKVNRVIDGKIVSMTLSELGINLNDTITEYRAIVPKSKVKDLTTARLVSGKPAGKVNKLTVEINGVDKLVSMTVDDWLERKANPLTIDDLAVKNGKYLWGYVVVKDKNGEPIMENGEPKLKKVLRANPNIR